MDDVRTAPGTTLRWSVLLQLRLGRRIKGSDWADLGRTGPAIGRRRRVAGGARRPAHCTTRVADRFARPAPGQTWLVAEHGAAAVTDLAEELAADLAEALDALAAAEGRPALAVLDGWFHDVPPPWDEPTALGTAASADPGEEPGGREDGQKPTRGGSAS
jgi:hypothetical protein